MNKSLLVKLFGFPATLQHGDTLVWDRWRWLARRLPRTNNGETLIDIGCGSGAFTIGGSLRGYSALGLSWDERNQSIASQRAMLCNAPAAKFEVLDVRQLDGRLDFRRQFDIALCCENIEHILNDHKLAVDISNCLKPGGRLLLTAPYLHYRAITEADLGPFETVENGWHVRRGYSEQMLRELCELSGLRVERISYCSGYFSQKITAIMRLLSSINPVVAWLLTLPLRVLPPLLDDVISSVFSWPRYSICLEAYKPRYADVKLQPAAATL